MSEHELWNELGNLYLMTGAYEQAVTAYARAIDLDKDYSKPYSNLALAYANVGRHADAIELYHKSIDMSADNTEKAVAWNRLGDLYKQLKDYTNAVYAYQTADQLELGGHEPQPVEPPAAPEPSVSAMEPIAEGLAFPPEPAVEESVVDVDVQVEEDLALSEWLPLESEPEEATFETSLPEMTYDEQTLSAAPEPPADAGLLPAEDGWVILSRASSEDVTAAPIEDAQAEEAEPKPLEAVAQAEDIWNDVVVSDPWEEVPQTSAMEDAPVEETPALAGPEMDEPKLSTAPLSMVEAVEPVPEPRNGNIRYHYVSDELAGIELDITRFKRVLQSNPRNALAWDTLGGLYKSLGRYDEAVLAFQQAISLDSTKAIYHHHLGLAYSAHGRQDSAIQAFQRVLELDPEHSLAHASLGGYYLKMGLTDLANQHIEKARSRFVDEESEYNRACLDAICGNVDESIELLKVALKKKQIYLDWMLHDPDLDFIRDDPRFQMLVDEYSPDEQTVAREKSG
jgi:tetratricopeptide (TPR) repeat protein